MKVQLSAEALAQPNAFRHLSAICWMFADMRHHWVVTEPDEIIESRWLAREHPERARAIAEQARRGSLRSVAKILMFARNSYLFMREDF